MIQDGLRVEIVEIQIAADDARVINGLRLSADDEATGLDLSQHGEEGYDMGS